MTEQQNESAVQEQTKTKRIRVLIAEDMESIRKRYERILNATEDMEVVSSLTASEMETLDLLIQGKTRREICRERHVEMSTVKTQIHEILRKFDRSSVKEVIEIIDRLDLYDMLFPKGKARTGKKVE